MICITPCGLAKLPYPAPASELYIGNYAKACMRYAISIAGENNTYILSAKYGFLKLTTIIEPYNVRFGDKDGVITHSHLVHQANVLCISHKIPLVVGGIDYVTPCRKIFPSILILTDYMTSRRMGDQISWMDKHHGVLPDKPIYTE